MKLLYNLNEIWMDSIVEQHIKINVRKDKLLVNLCIGTFFFFFFYIFISYIATRYYHY